MSGLEGASVTSPIENAASRSKTGTQVVPAFSVFHRFPAPAPTYIVAESRGSTAIASTRPPWNRGPTARHGRPANGESSRIATCRFHETRRSATGVASPDAGRFSWARTGTPTNIAMTTIHEIRIVY